jgi:hypothetical protein
MHVLPLLMRQATLPLETLMNYLAGGGNPNRHALCLNPGASGGRELLPLVVPDRLHR